MVTTLIVMSDSHGDRQIVQEIKARYHGQVAAIFHNGDAELEAGDAIWDGIQVVKGNCDWSDFPVQTMTEIDGLKIVQTHGHLQGINFGWTRLDYWAEEQAAAICLYGHLHVPDAEVREGCLFLNPGSVSQPRGRVQVCLYAKIELYPDHYHIEYLTRDHEVYAPLTRDIAR